MKVFVATSRGQGTRHTDFNDCIEGELVWMLDPCAESRRNPYGVCGCGRSFSGMNSHGSTTTAMVRDFRGLSFSAYTEALKASFDAQGWCPCCTQRDVRDVIRELIELAAQWPEGTVVERRLERLSARTRLNNGPNGTHAS